MIKYLSILSSIILALSLTVCGAAFECNRTGNDNDIPQ